VLRRWGNHVRRHPVLGVLEITLLWHAVLIAVAEGLPPLAPGWFPDLGASVVNLVCATVVLILLYALRMQGDVAGRGTRWYLALPLLVIALSYGLAGIVGTPAVLIGSAVSLILVGVNEEPHSRGLAWRSPARSARAKPPRWWRSPSASGTSRTTSCSDQLARQGTGLVAGHGARFPCGIRVFTRKGTIPPIRLTH
jgi:hypothetical protein